MGPDGRPVPTPGLPVMRPMADAHTGVGGEPSEHIRPPVTIKLQRPKPDDLEDEAGGGADSAPKPEEESEEPAAPTGSANPDFFYPTGEPLLGGLLASAEGEQLDRWSENGQEDGDSFDDVADVAASPAMDTRSKRPGVLRTLTESSIEAMGAPPDNVSAPGSVAGSGPHDRPTSASRSVRFSPEVGEMGAPLASTPARPLRSGADDGTQSRLRGGSRMHDQLQPYQPPNAEEQQSRAGQPYPSFEQDPYAAQQHSYGPDDDNGAWDEPAVPTSKTSSIWQLKQIASTRQSMRSKAHRKGQSFKKRGGQRVQDHWDPAGFEHGHGHVQDHWNPPGFEQGQPPLAYGQPYPGAYPAPPNGASFGPQYPPRGPGHAPSSRYAGAVPSKCCPNVSLFCFSSNARHNELISRRPGRQLDVADRQSGRRKSRSPPSGHHGGRRGSRSPRDPYKRQASITSVNTANPAIKAEFAQMHRMMFKPNYAPPVSSPSACCPTPCLPSESEAISLGQKTRANNIKRADVRIFCLSFAATGPPLLQQTPGLAMSRALCHHGIHADPSHR